MDANNTQEQDGGGLTLDTKRISVVKIYGKLI